MNANSGDDASKSKRKAEEDLSPNPKRKQDDVKDSEETKSPPQDPQDPPSLSGSDKTAKLLELFKKV